MFAKRLRFTLVIIALFSLFLSYSDFSKKAIADPLNQALHLYESKKFSEVIALLASDAETFQRIQPLYLLLKAYTKTGQRKQQLRAIEALDDNLPVDLLDVVLHERIRFAQEGDYKDLLLAAVIEHRSSITNPYLLEELTEILVRDFQDFQDQKALRRCLEKLMPLASSLKETPDLLRLYSGLFDENDARLQEIRLAIWKYGDVETLSRQEKAISQLAAADTGRYLDAMVTHFNTQRRYKNYTYMIRSLLPYLESIESKESAAFKRLRELYFFAMSRKRQYTHLIGILKQPDKQKLLGLTPFQALSHQFDLNLRKGHPQAAIDVLNTMMALKPDYDYDGYYVSLGDFYYNRDRLKQALYFFERLEPYEGSAYQIAHVKWKLWRTHFLLGNPSELKRIAQWAADYTFEDEEMGARFCYWGHKLGYYENGDLQTCYRRYPLTYYGLHSKFNGQNEKQSAPFTIPASISERSSHQIPERDQQELDFLALIYQLGTPELVDAIILSKLEQADQGMLLAYAHLALEAERYYLVQLIVESNFRSILENSRSAQKMLMPYFFPLAYDDHISRLEDKDVVPKTLILSVMREESHFNPEVKSVAGAVGLMQLMPATAKYVGKLIGLPVKLDSLTEPEINLKLGSAYLRRLIRRFKGNVFYALAAYNGGPTNVKRWIKKTKTKDNDDFVETITFPETQNYVRRVMRTYYLYQSLYHP